MPIRAALCVMEVRENTRSNIESVIGMTRRAARLGADLVLFPEASLTGLINCDDPERDLPLGVRVPGNVTEEISRVCRASQIFLGIGILERDSGRLYSSALLFNPQGDISLKYRRVSPGWHGPDADPRRYGSGERVCAVDTPLGRVAFLLCGDLFTVSPSIIADLSADWLLVPYARCSDDPEYSQDCWEVEERPHYVARVAEMSVATLMVNYMADSSICRGMCGTCHGGAYGGAMVVSSNGEMLASKPIGESGLLLAEVELAPC